jgi:ketosteroid isomerase-like protein
MRLSLILGCVALPLAAQAPAAPGPGASDTRTLLALEDQWAAALVRRDGATFERLLASGFVYTENDQLSTRDAVLRDIVSGADTAEAAHNEGMVVHPFGTTAVVTGWLIVRGHAPNGPFDRHYRFTDTWVRRNDRWQIVAAQDYIAPARTAP